MHHRQLLYTFYYFLLFMDHTYTRPLIEPRGSMVGGLLLPQLFLRQMEIEAQACQKGWQFWIQDELRNARTKPHVNGKGARGWFNHRLDLFRTSHNPSRTVAMDVPNLCNRIEFSRSKIDARGNPQVATSALLTNRFKHRFFGPDDPIDKRSTIQLGNQLARSPAAGRSSKQESMCEREGETASLSTQIWAVIWGPYVGSSRNWPGFKRALCRP